MPSQTGNGGRGGSWGRGTKSGPDLEDLIRQGQDQLKQIMPGGGSRGVIILVVIALAALGAWTAYYTVPATPLLSCNVLAGTSRKFRLDCISSYPWALM